MLRINFHPYTRDQLHKIVEARLAAAKEGLNHTETIDVFDQDAIKFAAMKVSSVTGDARRILDVCRFGDIVTDTLDVLTQGLGERLSLFAQRTRILSKFFM